MDPVTLAAIMGGVQMLSGAQKEKRDKTLAAATQRYSPWTGNKAGPIEYADPAATAMQTYGATLGMNQSAANQAGQQKLIDAQTKYFNSMAAGGGGATPGVGTAAISPYAMGQQNYWQKQLNSGLGYGG